MSELCTQMAMLGKGIGNENRFTILKAITKKSRTVGDIAHVAGISQPTVSQHLKLLKAAGLVEGTRKGQEVLYTANTELITRLLKKLTSHLT